MSFALTEIALTVSQWYHGRVTDSCLGTPLAQMLYMYNYNVNTLLIYYNNDCHWDDDNSLLFLKVLLHSF